jgi:hypothetical protein
VWLRQSDKGLHSVANRSVIIGRKPRGTSKTRNGKITATPLPHRSKSDSLAVHPLIATGQLCPHAVPVICSAWTPRLRAVTRNQRRMRPRMYSYFGIQCDRHRFARVPVKSSTHCTPLRKQSRLQLRDHWSHRAAGAATRTTSSADFTELNRTKHNVNSTWERDAHTAQPPAAFSGKRKTRAVLSSSTGGQSVRCRGKMQGSRNDSL